MSNRTKDIVQKPAQGSLERNKNCPDYGGKTAKAAHSPTPWEFKPTTRINTNREDFYILGSDGLKVAEIYTSSKKSGQKNAAFIVKAVNGYEAMEKLLNEVLEQMDETGGISLDLGKRIEAALAKAKGEAI